MIADRTRLEKCRIYRRSYARAPWVAYPWDVPKAMTYFPWNGRAKIRATRQCARVAA